MCSVLENKLIVDPVLLKTVGIPGHSPQIKDEESNAPKHGENIVHGIDSVFVVEVNDVEAEQHENSHDGDNGNSAIKSY